MFRRPHLPIAAALLLALAFLIVKQNRNHSGIDLIHSLETTGLFGESLPEKERPVFIQRRPPRKVTEKNDPPRSIVISTKFVEVSQEDAEELSFDWIQDGK